MKLNVPAFALAFGIWWGVGLFLLAWWIIWVVGPLGSPTFIERIYIGYEFTPVGSVIGFLWGFVDGLIGGAIVVLMTTAHYLGWLSLFSLEPFEWFATITAA